MEYNHKQNCNVVLQKQKLQGAITFMRVEHGYDSDSVEKLMHSTGAFLVAGFKLKVWDWARHCTYNALKD